MPTHRIDPQEIHELLPYARTENQSRTLENILACGGVSAAAAALEVPRTTIQEALGKVRANRAQHEERHTTPIKPHVPGDHRLKGVSTYANKNGEVDRQWIKTERDSHEPTTPIVPDGFEVEGVSSFVDGQGKLRAQWISSNRKERDKLALLKAATEQACEAYAGFCKPTKAKPPREYNRDILSVYGMGDPHVGMLSYGVETGRNFDLKIATEQTGAVVSRLVQAAAPSHTALLALIGDNFHADDDRQVTPGHGHKLDVDGRAPKVFRVGCTLWLAQITKMLAKHRKVLVNVTRGNHDPLTAFFLREWLCAMFKDEPRVEILDNVAEHQYIGFGKCMLGLTHGHKSKPDALVGVMATDEPEMWAAATVLRHWFTGHIHSKTFHDLRGCSLETLRTLAPNDAYAHGAGYRSTQSSIVVDIHAEFGEIARQTVNLARAGINIERKSRGYHIQLGAQ